MRILKRNTNPLFLSSFLSLCFIFLSLPENSYSGLAQPSPDCCQIAPNECFDLGGGGIDEPVPLCPVDDVIPGFCNDSSGMCEPLARPIPALGEWGLISVIIALGTVGAAGIFVYRRKKASA